MATFTQIQSDVAEELNLSSSTVALARIGRNINKAYRAVCSSLGLEMTARGAVTANTAPPSRYVTFANVQKLFAVTYPGTDPPSVLDKVLYDDLLNLVPGGDPPQKYADYTTTATSVTIYLDCEPATIYALNADALILTTTLSGVMTPNFAEDFHDLLEYWAKAAELRKMEKYAEADVLDAGGRVIDDAGNPVGMFGIRLAALRHFYARSGYLALYQGKTETNQSPILPLTI